ncbi:MAG: serine/threonine protein kinase, partial [Anaerolineae bacterium]|nr:serine/threonine protein kinase [Anaerolineae bacterium]
MRSSDPIIGRKLGDYAIVDVLGHGGMARVYRGYDAKLDRYAAVKVIDSTMMIGQDPEEYRSRFQKEGRAIAHLRHPNIVTVYQFDQVGTLYYMAMSFIEGKDLRHVLKSFSRSKTFMPYGQVLRIIYDMASALDYAHSAGVIHRDIKPSNIMVTPDGHAVLTDFGLALNRSEGTIGNTFGSAYYIAPEQAVSSAQSVPQSDLYSLGVVLYEMLAGRMPFDDPAPMQVALQHLNNAPPPPSTFNPLITREIDRMVLKTLDKKPERRYPTGVAMTKALKDALGVVNDDDTFKLNIMQLPNWGEERRSTSSTPLTDISNSSRREVSSTRRQMVNLDRGELTPQFGAYTDDSPTVTQSKISARLRGEIFPEPRRRRPIGIYLAILLFVLAGVIVMAGIVLLPRLMT